MGCNNMAIGEDAGGTVELYYYSVTRWQSKQKVKRI